MRLCCLAVLVSLALFSLAGCMRHTYYMELNNGQTFYADPPLVLDTEAGVYYVGVGGVRRTIPIDDVRYLDDTAQVCYQNIHTDTYTCYEAFYQF